MIVERRFEYPKAGCRGDLEELMKAQIQRILSNPHPHLHAIRLYSHDIGCSAPFALEFEFESYEEREKYWDAHYAEPETAVAGEKYRELVDRYNTNEIWNLVI